ncbi:MAG: twin-arginine translocation signal domain-containing protein, partial [Rubrobacter sp.]|nr:twin-arginine translocation signal domain-containing protein [Rubrobacter sp.]
MPSKAKGNDAPSFSGKARSRRDFLKLSGIGIAGVALLGGMTAFSLARRVDSVIASELGISPDNDGVTNRENLVKALSYDNRNVVFLPGDYVIDNSKAESERGLNDNFHIAIDWFEGELAMESGARFVFTDNTRRGFVFHAGNGAKFKGLSSVFQTPPERRVIPEECFAFHYLDNILVEDAYIDGSTSVGLLFYGCVEPKVYGARILNTMADGLHFADCQDSRAENIYTENTGDDGLAFINYAEPAKPDGSAYSGGYATNITVKDSKARGIVTIG